MRTSFLIVILISMALTGCWKSENSYATEARAAVAANNPSEAERILQEGISKHSDSNVLVSNLVNLYANTNQLDKLESYLRMNYFEHEDSYMRELAMARFENKEWGKSYKAYIYVGDRSFTYENKCPMVAAEDYRNAAAASMNAGVRSWYDSSMKRLTDMIAVCNAEEANQIREYIVDLGK